MILAKPFTNYTLNINEDLVKETCFRVNRYQASKWNNSLCTKETAIVNCI